MASGSYSVPSLLVHSGGSTRLLPDGSKVKYTVGRADEADFVLADRRVSWEHAVLRVEGTMWVLEDLGSRNGIFADSRRVDRLEITGPRVVHFGLADDGPAMRFEPVTPDVAPYVAEVTVRPGVDTNPTMTKRLSAEAEVINIGRRTGNDVVVSDLAVSKVHAQLRRSVTGRYQIVDLASHNGTFVNGVRVHKADLSEDDLVSIGHSTFRLAGGELREYVDEGRASFAARDLLVTVAGRDEPIIADITFPLAERSMMAVIGPAGAGKSTLLNALTGKSQATSGAVLYDNRDLYQGYEALRDRIGLVPQNSVTHDALTARMALGYAAELRFSSDVVVAERRQRIEEVLSDLEMSEHGDKRIEKLSGGQNKRVNIGLELLTKPSMLFLDEPTSPLDPHLKRQLFRQMRAMADKNAKEGQSVVVITHDVEPSLLDLCDRLLVLTPRGRMAYFGPPREGLKYFGKLDWADVFQAFADAPGTDWADAFQASKDYLKYVATPMAPQLRQPAPSAPSADDSPGGRRRGLLSQALIMARRQFRVMAADRMYLVIAAVLPLVLGGVFRAMATPLGLGGGPGQNSGAAEPLLILTLAACLSGAMNSIREIVKERGLFERERMAGVSPGAYLVSKVLALGTVSLVQAVLVVVIGLTGERMPQNGSLLTGQPFLELLIAIAVTSFVAMLVGLAISSLASEAEQVLPTLVIVTLVQVMFTGAAFPLKTWMHPLSDLFPARWGLGLVASTVNLNVIEVPGTFPRDALWNHTSGQWLTDLAALLFIGLICAAVTYRRLATTGPGGRKRRV